MNQTDYLALEMKWSRVVQYRPTFVFVGQQSDKLGLHVGISLVCKRCFYIYRTRKKSVEESEDESESTVSKT